MRVFLFDIDGTLIRSGGAGQAALAAALEAAFGIEQRADVDLHGRTDRWIAKQLFEGHSLANTEAHWELLRDAYLRLLPHKLRDRAGDVLPGAAELVRQLAGESNVAVGLLTGNIRQGASIKLSHYGLAALLSPSEHGGFGGFGGFGDVHDCRNRVAADALQSARDHVGGALEPEQVWVIGDTPRDVECARAIGARAAAVATGGYSRPQLAASQPDLLLDTLADCLELLMTQ